MNPMAFSVEGAGDLTGLKRTTMFQLIKTGEIRSFKVGSRRLIAAQDLADFIDRMRAMAPEGRSAHGLASDAA